MSYSVDDLIGQFRTQMDDNVEPFLWDEDRIIEWIDEAQKVFAERTKIFQGSEILTVLAADGGNVTIPSYVLEIRRAKYTGQVRALDILNFNDISRGSLYDDYGINLTDDWEESTGTPRALVPDYKTDAGRLVPKPVADGTMTLYYARYPLKDITASSSKIELTDTRHQRLMVVYARAMAYGDHDADVYDPRAEVAKMDEFHTKVDVITAQIKRKTRRAGTVRYGGL